jgi:hypothetical protein
MNRKSYVFPVLALCLAALSATAELQNVELSGRLNIRGNYITNWAVTPPAVRYSPAYTLGRPVGGPFAPAVVSPYKWDKEGPDYSAVEQRTRLGVKADFTNDVSTFIEFDSYNNWGTNFRSNYLTGIDSRGDADVSLFQAYINIDKMWGAPLSLRVGRQELSFGSQWLVGPRDFGFFWTGISFDAVRATYAGDSFTVDAWAAKLAESFGNLGKNDTDFYGVYATCKAIENHTFDAYWMALSDNTPGMGDTLFHTTGLRGAGKCAAFDYDMEVAYQFGSNDAAGFTFGDPNVKVDVWGGKIDLGYTVDTTWQPRFFLSGRYYGGEDNRDISFGEWLCPFDTPSASVSFNRLFSNEISNGFLDLTNDLSNAWWARLGVIIAPVEKVHSVIAVTHYETVDAFDRPVVPVLSFWTKENSKDLGWEFFIFNEYQYSEDLAFEFGWSHLFVGAGLQEGNYSSNNGLVFNGGSGSSDADYFYGGCKISF